MIFFTIISEILDKYNSISFDLDETLIGDNPYKDLFKEYILKNSHKNFTLITFRKSKDLYDLDRELYKETKEKNFLEKFKNFVYLPENYLLKEIIFWKGKVCSQLNSEILVDDLEDFVFPGCKKYKISYLNSITLRYYPLKNK